MPSDNDLRTRETPSRPAAAITFALALLLSSAALALGQTSLVQRYLNINDDNLYLYTTSLRAADREQARRLDELILAEYEQAGASENLIFRYELRADHAYNYLVLTGSLALAQRIFAPVAHASGPEFADHLAKALLLGVVLPGVLAAVVTVVAMGSLQCRIILGAFALALAFMFFVDSSLVDRGYERVMGASVPAATPALLDGKESIIERTFWQLARPRHGFTVFGFLAKAHLWLMLMPVFALRWCNRFTAAYALLFVLAAFHQTMTGLFVAFLVALDLIVRPRTLLGRPVLFLVLALLGLHLAREQLWMVILPASAWPYALIGGGLVFLAALIVLLRRRGDAGAAAKLRQVITQRPELFEPRDLRGRILLDLGGVTALWLVTLPVAYVVNRIVGELQSTYFWEHAHGRMLAGLRPPLIMGAICLGLVWAQRRGWRAALPGALATALVAVCLIGASEIANADNPLARMSAKASALEADLKPIEAIDGPDEMRVYYAFARTMQTDLDAVSLIFPPP